MRSKVQKVIPSTHRAIGLAEFVRWKARSCPSWQLQDFREQCLDGGRARAHRPLLDWLRDFRAFTKDDAWVFDADGGGKFVIT